jgi:hypothetical protein
MLKKQSGKSDTPSFIIGVVQRDGKNIKRTYIIIYRDATD